ncbi:hypothetical protein PCLA_01r0064 [Pseudomonas citronellolis]|nr:hypothetical protein PCLA_01r0064 [Pseudomonas citronellolis]
MQPQGCGKGDGAGAKRAWRVWRNTAVNPGNCGGAAVGRRF